MKQPIQYDRTGGPLKDKVFLWWGAVLLLGFLSQISLAQDTDRKITALYIESPIVIDGNLDEAAWSLAEVATDFIQNDPKMGEPATERTEVRILYDDGNFYLGVYCFDSAGKEGLIVTQVSRDFSPREGDHFTFIVDTFDDNRNGVVFGTNPQGAKREGQMSEDGGRSNYDWDGIWDVKSKITDAGGQAEFSIPFRTLRFSNTEQQVWGVNFSRRIRRKDESVHWSPIPRPYRLSRTSRAGELSGITGIRQGPESLPETLCFGSFCSPEGG